MKFFTDPTGERTRIYQPKMFDDWTSHNQCLALPALVRAAKRTVRRAAIKYLPSEGATARWLAGDQFNNRMYDEITHENSSLYGSNVITAIVHVEDTLLALGRCSHCMAWRRDRSETVERYTRVCSEQWEIMSQAVCVMEMMKYVAGCIGKYARPSSPDHGMEKAILAEEILQAKDIAAEIPSLESVRHMSSKQLETEILAMDKAKKKADDMSPTKGGLRRCRPGTNQPGCEHAARFALEYFQCHYARKDEEGEWLCHWKAGSKEDCWGRTESTFERTLRWGIEEEIELTRRENEQKLAGLRWTLLNRCFPNKYR